MNPSGRYKNLYFVIKFEKTNIKPFSIFFFLFFIYLKGNTNVFVLLPFIRGKLAPSSDCSRTAREVRWARVTRISLGFELSSWSSSGSAGRPAAGGSRPRVGTAAAAGSSGAAAAQVSSDSIKRK